MLQADRTKQLRADVKFATFQKRTFDNLRRRHHSAAIMTDTSDQKSIDSFRSSLDANYEWPSIFPFKFIVPKDKTEEVLALFDIEPSRAKESSSGRFTAYTMEVKVSSSDEVLEIYERVSKVPNVISL